MTRARAAVLVTGSEILLGRTVDTNSSYLARQLDLHGVRLVRVVAVDDAEDSIVGALEQLLATGVDLVLTSGGLGPTHDDRTVACVARVAGVPLVLDEPTLATIDGIVAEFARARGMDPAGYVRGNRKQATVPAGARDPATRGHGAGRDRADRRPADRGAAGPAGGALPDVADGDREPARGAAPGRRAAAEGAADLRRPGIDDRRRVRGPRRRRRRHRDDHLRVAIRDRGRDPGAGRGRAGRRAPRGRPARAVRAGGVLRGPCHARGAGAGAAARPAPDARHGGELHRRPGRRRAWPAWRAPPTCSSVG